MAAATVARWKGMITACAFGAVTFVGTIYGAGLKTQQEYKAVSLSYPLWPGASLSAKLVC